MKCSLGVKLRGVSPGFLPWGIFIFDMQLRQELHPTNASINSSGAHPPPPPSGNVASPGGGAFSILSGPRGLGISIPRGDLRAFDTRVFERQISIFIGKDEAFAKDWLVHQGLEKLVDVF